jgi:hypothetical protein
VSETIAQVLFDKHHKSHKPLPDVALGGHKTGRIKIKNKLLSETLLVDFLLFYPFSFSRLLSFCTGYVISNFTSF